MISYLEIQQAINLCKSFQFSRMKTIAIQPKHVCPIRANANGPCASIRRNFATRRQIASTTNCIMFAVSKIVVIFSFVDSDDGILKNFIFLDDPNAGAKCAELKCSYNCKVTPAGPKCYCPAGQEPVNGTQCQGL